MMEYREDSFYINKVIKGDVSAYACLVEKYKSLAYTLALRIVRNPQDAEEIAQDAFVKAYNSLSKFKGDSKFSTWLYKIIYNTSVSKLRKKEIKTVSIDNRKHEGIYYSEQQDNFNTINLNDRVEILRLCFEKLSEEEKTIYESL